MTLPCKSENDHCWRSKPCRYRRELDNGLRTPEWVEARCETLAVRREGFVEVDASPLHGDAPNPSQDRAGRDERVG